MLTLYSRWDAVEKVETARAISLMEASEFKFHLTGSRFFGGYTYYSDWDFFAEDSHELREWLADCRFLELLYQLPYTDDPNICTVFNRGQVHIQLVRDLALKERAQMELTEVPVFVHYRKATKPERRAWWKWAFRIAILTERK